MIEAASPDALNIIRVDTQLVLKGTDIHIHTFIHIPQYASIHTAPLHTAHTYFPSTTLPFLRPIPSPISPYRAFPFPYPTLSYTSSLNSLPFISLSSSLFLTSPHPIQSPPEPSPHLTFSYPSPFPFTSPSFSHCPFLSSSSSTFPSSYSSFSTSFLAASFARRRTTHDGPSVRSLVTLHTDLQSGNSAINGHSG